MTAKPYFAIAFLVFYSIFSPQSEAGQPLERKSKAENLFIVIADGLRYSDAFGNKNHLYTEYIWRRLRPLGTICTNFYNTGQTYPIPAQASLLTGVWHIFENPKNTRIRPAFPTLFEYWNKKRNGEEVASYFASGRMQYEILTSSENRDYGGAYAPIFETIIKSCGDKNQKKDTSETVKVAVFSKAVDYIFKRHPSFVYLNLDSDSGGEGSYSHALECRLDGCSEEAAEQVNIYYENIILFDSLVNDLWDRIQSDEIYKDNSIFIFLSTHGRHTSDFRSFGDNCVGCQQLNLLILGPGVKKNFISKKKRTLIDVCPTLGALFNISTPFAKGKIMEEILE